MSLSTIALCLASGVVTWMLFEEGLRGVAIFLILLWLVGYLI